MTGDDREHRVRERAYRLWEDEGRPEGRHEHHWTQASQEVGDELFQQGGSLDAMDRPGALDGGLLPEGALAAGGGPSGSGVAGLGMAGEPTHQQQGDMGGGLSSGLQPGGTISGASPAAGVGSLGTGGGSTGDEATGTVSRQQE
jgi:hypothetical protein